MNTLKGDQLFSDDAARCADMMAVLEDIAQSHDAAKTYLTGRYAGDGDTMRTRKALYESALISLRRAMENGVSRIPGTGRRTWSIPAEDVNRVVDPDKDEFQQIMDPRRQMCRPSRCPRCGAGAGRCKRSGRRTNGSDQIYRNEQPVPDACKRDWAFARLSAATCC